jgi:hypothetical protein
LKAGKDAVPLSEDPEVRTPAAAAPQEEFFDASFLAELETLAGSTPAAAPAQPSAALHDRLAAFLAPREPLGEPLTEVGFLALAPEALSDRTNVLVEICREGGRGEAALAVENFIVFFQALVPTLSAEGSGEIKRFFFRLAPTLLHIAHNDFGEDADSRTQGRQALRNLETILIEISSVRLAPSESELVFRSIDQLAAFIAVGEYLMANEIVSSQLLSIITRNKLLRSLFRLMEVEANLQRYLKERLGCATPQLRVPEDFPLLADYGPMRILQEVGPDGRRRPFVQIQIPDIPLLRDVVLHLVPPAGNGIDLRLDSLGSAELAVDPGVYTMGLLYQPQ